MITFFFSIYHALFTGAWNAYTLTEVSAKAEGVWGDVLNFAVNAFGGNFATIETFTPTMHPFDVICLVLSFATLVGVCLGVWKLTKAVFGIFFSRA